MKISTEGIAGFAEMTDAQKLQAVLGLDIPDPIDLSGYVKKDLYDKTSSELATAKKSLREKMTTDEQKAAENAQAFQELQEKYAALEKENSISKTKAQYLSMPGYDDTLASETAEALYNGDMAKVFANQKKASENYEKKLKADWMKSTPAPGGSYGGTETKDEAVEMAKAIGAKKALSMKSSNDALNYYK